MRMTVPGLRYPQAGDVDGDGHADLLIGALWADGFGNSERRAGETYLISGDDLEALDAADGTKDGGD